MALNKDRIKKFFKGIYKAWKWFLTGLRWVSIVVFGILFFAGLYFKLPPKMLACLAVIPVVGIFVPRKIQKYVWGALTVVLLSVWGWVHLPEQSSSAWHPYQYEQERAALEENVLPDGAPNAADLYLTILNEHDEGIFDFQFATPDDDDQTLSAAWDPQVHPGLDAWLADYESAIDTFITAAQIEHCRFEVPADLESMNVQMRRINQLKGWSRLLIRAANRDLYSGNHEQALEKLLAVAALAQHLYQQQTLFDQAAAFHIELLGARALEKFIIDHCGHDEHLESIEQSFLRLDPGWAGNWPEILLREKLLTKNLAALMYEENSSGRIRISHNAMLALQAGLGYRPRRLFWNQEEMNRIAVIGLWLTLPASPAKLSRLIDDRFDHYSLQVQKGEQLPRYTLEYLWKHLWMQGFNIRSIIDWLATEKVGYFWALDGQFRRHEAIVHQIHVFCGLKRYAAAHDRWPARLEELGLDPYILTDPLCGKPFVYESAGVGFRLYSLGPNGVDDGCINDPKADKDDILLWPRAGIEEELTGS